MEIERGISSLGENRTYKVLYQGELPTVAAALYTVPANTQAIVTWMTLLCTENNNGSLYVGGTNNNTNIILATVAFTIDEFAEWDGWMPLEAAQTIGGLASSSATALTLTVSGYEVT